MPARTASSHADVGRPDQVSIFFERGGIYWMQGAFRTKVFATGVDPQLSCYYRASRLKQYWKEGRALCIETVIGDAHDFGIGRRVCPQELECPAGRWRRRQHASVRRASCGRSSCPRRGHLRRGDPAVHNIRGLTGPGLRFGDPRVMVLLSALVGFGYLMAGVTNRGDLRPVAPQTEKAHPPAPRSSALPAHAARGRVAVLFVKMYGRVLTPGLIALDPDLPPELAARSPLALAWRHLDRTLDDFISQQAIAA